MPTTCMILRTNRTMTQKKVKDKEDDFKFEGGLYYVRREKVFLFKTAIRGKIKPTLLYIEGVSDPLYLDNLKLKVYTEKIPLFDEKTKKPLLDKNDKQLYKMDGKNFVMRMVRTIEDIFIDARAIHNLTDKKILAVLSAQASVTAPEIILIVLVIIGICIGIVSLFI